MVYATLVFLNTMLIPYLFWSELFEWAWEEYMPKLIQQEPYLASMILGWGINGNS